MRKYNRTKVTCVFAFLFTLMVLAGYAGLQEVDAVSSCDHDYVKTEAHNATATTCGNYEYWTCSKCGGYFLSPNESDETYKNAWLIPAQNSFGKYDAGDIASVELIPVNSEPYELLEEDIGWYATDANGNKYFSYYFPYSAYNLGDILRLHLHNGSVVDYVYTPNLICGDYHSFINIDDETDVIGIWTAENNGYYESISDQTAREPGEIFDYQFKYKGHSYSAQVKIRPNMISSVEYETYDGKPIQIEENDPFVGHNETDGSGISFFFYQQLPFHMGDKVTVNYSSGTTKTYTLCINDDCYKGFIAADGEILNGNFDWSSDQLSDHWLVDNTYTCDFMFNRRTCKVSIEIIPSYGQPSIDPDRMTKNDFGYYHTWDTSYTVDEPATCINEGRESIHCSVCGVIDGTTVEVIPKADHTYGDWTVTEKASCTKGGSREKVCSVCKDKVTEDIPALGHDWSTNPTVDNKATCTDDGQESVHCIRCDAVKEGSKKTIPATEHKYGDWVTTKAVTCTSTGSKQKTCSKCGNKVSETIAATGHEYGDWVTTRAATCTSTGSKEKTCSNCGNKVSETIAATGHKYGDWVTTKAATCISTGLKEKTCSKCGNKVSETIPATGHRWKSDYTVDRKATYAAAGLKSIHCSVCNAVKKDSKVSIPKLTVKATSITKVPAVKNGFTVKWKKGENITGYQIQYALNKKFTKSKKTITIKKKATVSKKISNLKAGKKYYVRIRTYKTVSGKKYYSKWSKVKTVTTKN